MTRREHFEQFKRRDLLARAEHTESWGTELLSATRTLWPRISPTQ